MLRNCTFIGLAFCITIAASSAAFAFDHQREGFILGIGLGPGFTSFTEKIESPWFSRTADRKNNFAVMTDFKLGYAPSDIVLIYWMSKVSWFDPDSRLLANGVGGAGLTYFLKPEAPSGFVTGGLGLSTWGPIFENSGGRLYGFGIAIGAGYEFSRHWTIEVAISWGNPKEKSSSTERSTDVVSLGLTVNLLNY